MSDAVRHQDSDSSGLTLTLLPEAAVFHHDHEPSITAHLRNDGEQTLRLVMPGDGSLEAWRTPVIEWIFMHIEEGRSPRTTSLPRRPPVVRKRVFGNIDRITQDDVFTLAPGESRELGRWVLPPVLPATATFAASMTYLNDPSLELRGLPRGPHDAVALELIRGSDQCWACSNEIIVSFQDYPSDALRKWFPEIITTLRERCSEAMGCNELIGLRNEIQQQLGAIRADLQIQPGIRWIVDERAPVRVMRWCDEPQISVRALILALGRFQIADAQAVSDLEQRWRLFRREQGLDVKGAPTPTGPPTNPLGTGEITVNITVPRTPDQS